MSIGQLQDGDFSEWAEVWRLYLQFYETELPEAQYKNTWARITAPDGDLHAFVARDDDGRIIGLSHYLFHTSSWSDKPVCYLNDLYVRETGRKQGVGRRLILATAKAAEDKGCDTLYWATRESNAVARRVYDALAKLEFVTYRMALPTDLA